MRTIAYSLLFFLVAIPIALYLLYRWRKNATKKLPSAKSAAGPASVPVKTPLTTSSGGPSVLPDLLQSSAYINSLGPSAGTYDPTSGLPFYDGTEAFSSAPTFVGVDVSSVAPPTSLDWNRGPATTPLITNLSTNLGSEYGPGGLSPYERQIGGGGAVQLPSGAIAYKSGLPPTMVY